MTARRLPRPVRPWSLLTLLVVFAALLVLAGCGGAGGPPPPKPQATKPAKVRPTAAVPVGSGQIAFGTGSAAGRLTGVRHSFTTPARLTWSAHLTHALSAPAKLLVTFINDTGPGPHPRTAWSGLVSVPPTDTVTGSMTRVVMRSRQITDGAKFTVRYSVAGQVIATGEFRLNNRSGQSVGY